MQHRLISKLYFLWSKVLHSIPILLNKKSKRRTRKLTTKTYLRYVSYSIPLMCSLALLLLFCNLFIISDIDKTYAEGNITEVSDDDSNGNAGISTYATTTVNPTASLTIGGDATNKQVIASPGSTAYRSHTVTVDASDIESYALVLSGPTNLTSGTSTIVSGSNNTTPAAMENNTWGYSWGGESKESSTYQSLLTSGVSLSGERVSGFKVNFTRNLFFAAKFSEDADPGRYQANVTLSLAATPRAVATGFNGIYDMQDMTGEICAKANIGDTGSLEDIRDGNVYSVAKLSDGNCWMTRNLRIDISKANSLSSNDTNIAEGTTWPETDVETPMEVENGTWSTSNNAILFAKHPVKIYGDSGTYQEPYGYYYSWCAATAGSCVDSGDASSSICPKEWRLPTRSEYAALIEKGKSGWAVNNGVNGYWVGGAANAVGAAFFSATGHVDSNGLTYGGSRGNYWSSTAHSNTTHAYSLYFQNDTEPYTVDNFKYRGRPVRCVAEMPKYTVTFDGNSRGGTVANIPEEISCALTSSGSCMVVLPDNALEDSCAAVRFVGWSTEKLGTLPKAGTFPSTMLSPGSDLMVMGDTILYAVWQETGASSTCSNSGDQQ